MTSHYPMPETGNEEEQKEEKVKKTLLKISIELQTNILLLSYRVSKKRVFFCVESNGSLLQWSDGKKKKYRQDKSYKCSQITIS